MNPNSVAETIGFDDDSHSSQSQAVTYTQIVMEHIRTISQLSCKDWFGGYWMKNEGVVLYRESSRESYMNAVDGLYDLCEHKLDEDAQAEFKTFIDEYKALEKQVFEFLSQSPVGDDFTENDVDYELDKLAKKRRDLFRIIIRSLNRIKFFDGDSVAVEEVA